MNPGENELSSSGTSSVSPVERRARIEAILDRLPEVRALVVGDLLLDEYRTGEVERISPEAPVPIVRILESRCVLGGAGNVARGVLAVGANCRLVAMAGCDTEGDQAFSLLEEAGLSTKDIIRTADRATPHKVRIVARGQQMMRLDREDSGPVSVDWLEAARDRVALALPNTDVMILEDYGKGLLSVELSAWLIREAQNQGVLVVVDPKRDILRFRGADLVKPNVDEARALVPSRVDDFDSRRSMLEKIQRELGGAEIVLTRGSDGMTALEREGRTTDLPTRAAEVFDVQGAGDTSVAMLALCRAAGASLVDACIVANAGAAIAVGKRGTATVDLAELRTRVPDALARFEESK